MARLAKTSAATKPETKATTSASKSGTPANKAARKLNNKEQRELAELPSRIAAFEKEQADLTSQLGDPELYKDGGTKAKALQERHAVVEKEHAAAVSRWLELEG